MSLEKLERIQLIGESLTGVENRKDLLIASSTLAGSQKYSLKLTNQVTEVQVCIVQMCKHQEKAHP